MKHRTKYGRSAEALKPHARIEQITQAVAEKIQTRLRARKWQARQGRHMRMQVEHFAAVIDHPAPIRLRWLIPESDEADSSSEDDDGPRERST